MASSLILICKVCNSSLSLPTTLSCGHSICSHHLPLVCPCSPHLHHHSSSPPKLDVTLNKIINLRRKRKPLPSTSSSTLDEEPDLLTHLRAQSAHHRASADEALDDTKQLLEQLSCEICFQLLYQPVTTPCQHTFCYKCLLRSLDHSPNCPLCRHQVPNYFEHPYNTLILSLILKSFSSAYQERGEMIAEEERHARLDTPIFVCQLSFPGTPTVLRFFEPRYLLMLRRCIEYRKPRFGMIVPPKAGSPSTDPLYGTMLEIQSVQTVAGNQSMVETWGTYRFRVLEHGTLDGYMVGRIEKIEDDVDDIAEGFPEQPPVAASTSSAASSPSPPPTSSPSGSSSSTFASTLLSVGAAGAAASLRPRLTNEDLMDICREFIERVKQGTAPWVVQRYRSAYGTMPTEPGPFSFWVAMALPIEEHEKAKLLPIRSPRLRLMLVVYWIEQLNKSWWFTAGCTIL